MKAVETAIIIPLSVDTASLKRGVNKSMSFSTNGDFEQLVEQITDVIYARLNGEPRSGEDGRLYV